MKAIKYMFSLIFLRKIAFISVIIYMHNIWNKHTFRYINIHREREKKPTHNLLNHSPCSLIFDISAFINLQRHTLNYFRLNDVIVSPPGNDPLLKWQSSTLMYFYNKSCPKKEHFSRSTNRSNSTCLTVLKYNFPIYSIFLYRVKQGGCKWMSPLCLMNFPNVLLICTRLAY